MTRTIARLSLAGLIVAGFASVLPGHQSRSPAILREARRHEDRRGQREPCPLHLAAQRRRPDHSTRGDRRRSTGDERYREV